MHEGLSARTQERRKRGVAQNASNHRFVAAMGFDLKGPRSLCGVIAKTRSLRACVRECMCVFGRVNACVRAYECVCVCVCVRARACVRETDREAAGNG